MKLAAIDIGSNAVRLQVSSVIHSNGQPIFKKLEYVRFPLRLGQDVFNHGKISRDRVIRFKKLMKAFKLLIDLYEVEDYLACATSAMREASNGREIVEAVRKDCGLEIGIIDGRKEALLINNVIISFLDPSKNYIHIDVGGGSTELNIYQLGSKIATRSFNVGSVRRLDHHDSPVIWKTMKKWVKEHAAGISPSLIAVGTGGNINKVFDLAYQPRGSEMQLEKIQQIAAMVASKSLEERINELQLNPDRADVIVPATEIYLAVMEWADAAHIIVPDVGLKDGMLQQLYNRNPWP